MSVFPTENSSATLFSITFTRHRGLCNVRDDFSIKVVGSLTPSLLLSAKSHATPLLFAPKRAHNAHACYQLFAGVPAARGELSDPIIPLAPA